MGIRYLHTRDPSLKYIFAPVEHPDNPLDALPRPTEGSLLKLDGTCHSASATQVLCAAATWAYADLSTFARMMRDRGLHGEFVEINVTNRPAFLDTTAYLYLSASAQVAILTFRGTEMTNLANWLADASAVMQPQDEGWIHSGFLNAGIPVLSVLRKLLEGWAKQRKNLAETLLELRLKSTAPVETFPPKAVLEEGAGSMGFVRSAYEEFSDASTLGPALYICGHSLGGALAAMAGTIIHLEPALSSVRDRLRSIYTFGQPMFADKVLAQTLDKRFGERMFRHRYGNDIVPRLPARIQGNFHHFGRSYVSSKGVWVRERTNLLRRALTQGQTLGVVSSNVIGLLAWVKQQFPILQWVPLSLSWGDHAPLNYLRTSQAPRAGWEILGPESED